ncbi:MAG: crossover junction endodeoxyribonuclease RuvC [Chloroflexi bacterium]|nr:crossover junction endodeoxyribonuclease RuvC [Chloroflexota bacterium]
MGYGIVRSKGDSTTLVTYGVITTPPSSPLAERLQTVYVALIELIDRHRPGEVAVEALFFNRNVRSAFAVGQARGVALLAAAHRGLAVSEYTPLQVKQTITGYGRATKDQIQNMLPVLLDCKVIPQPDDAADAVAIAICHLHLSQLSRVLRERQEDGSG